MMRFLVGLGFGFLAVLAGWPWIDPALGLHGVLPGREVTHVGVQASAAVVDMEGQRVTGADQAPAVNVAAVQTDPTVQNLESTFPEETVDPAPDQVPGPVDEAPPLADRAVPGEQSAVRDTASAKPVEGYEPVWVPFHSRLSAAGFAELLSRNSGHALKVTKLGHGRYEVGYEYASLVQRDEIRLALNQVLADVAGPREGASP